jgi:hypothetical protein
VSGFTADWLALREPADHAARSDELSRAAARADRILEIVDLGSGTGANLRYLAPRLAGRQRWHLVDDDAMLLEAALAATESWADREAALAVTGHAARFHIRGAGMDCDVAVIRADVAAERPAWAVPLEGLVTASALLDLVSAVWLERIAERCAAAKAAALLALTYDGRMTLAPQEPGDARVRMLVNRHQRRDKGLGPALGPEAFTAAAEAFATRGYTVASAFADWHLGHEEGQLQARLLDGWAAAAVEEAPAEGAALRAWHGRRMAHVAAGRSRITVGHRDLLAQPPAGGTARRGL